ncbi:MAG TPA: PTS glucitol/sorbitol transporter subunit IIA [Thermoanaerobacterales bacterium]|nr:PTS glucitol/sorbitol transporter subunit IIA [Thermoanaerobacterales bacterium]
MNEIKCKTFVKSIGDEALGFLDEKMLILFGDMAGNGLENYSMRIDIPKCSSNVSVNDIFIFGKEKYTITAVGEKVMETFMQLGHCTLRFDGAKEAALPGSVHLLGKKLPEVSVGDSIMIISSGR